MKLTARWHGGFAAARQGGWLSLVLYFVGLILSIVLAPKPPTPKAAAITDFDIPTAQEDRPIPVLFGTKRITGANVLWYGDLNTLPIRKHSLFSSTTIGYRYYLGMHLGLCHGPVNALLKIEAGDKAAWDSATEGEFNINGDIQIAQDELFGGDTREGGLGGVIRVMFGADDQAPDTYLAHVHGIHGPAYRGIFGLVWDRTSAGGFGFDHGYIGTSAYIKPWAVTLRRTNKGWANNDPWYPEKCEISKGAGSLVGMNPAHIIYECLTNPEWGQGSPASCINDAQFREVADQLHVEGFGLCILWSQTATINDFIAIVLDHIAGVLGFDHTTGLYELRLIRGDYDYNSLPTCDTSNILSVSKFERRGWGETVNELTMTYTDPTTLKPTVIVVQDLGNIRSQGVRIPFPLDMSGIYDPDLATVVAGRELSARSTPLARIEFKANRQFWLHGVASVVKITWPKYDLNAVAFRILNVKGGTLEDGTISVVAVEDIFALQGIEYSQIPGSNPSPIIPTTPVEETDSSGTVVSKTTTVPPATTLLADGDRWYVPPGATGAWSGHAGQVAVWDAASSSWVFLDVPQGTIVYSADDQTYFTSSAGGAAVPILGDGTSTGESAEQTSYDDSVTQLGADNVQDALAALVKLSTGGNISVRAATGGIFYAQSTNLTLFDAVDALHYSQRDSVGQTTLQDLIKVGTLFHGRLGSKMGASNTTNVYGAWTYRQNGSEAWVGLRYISAKTKFVAFRGSEVQTATDGLHFSVPTNSAPSYQSVVAADSPACWLRLGDDVNYSRDSIAGNNAVFAPASGSPLGTGWTPGVAGLTGAGTAVAFLGMTYVEPRAAGSAPINLIAGTADFSVELWVAKNVTAPVNDLFLFCQGKLLTGSSGTFNQVALSWEIATKTIRLQLRGSYDDTAFPGPLQLDLSAAGVQDLFDGEPHHVVARRGTGGRAAIWIDAVQVATVASGTVVDITTGSLAAGTTFGANFGANSTHYSSTLDELAIYATELSDARVAAHYAAGHRTLSEDFEIQEITWDNSSHQRWLVFGHLAVPVGPDVVHRPRLYASADLASFQLLAALAPTPLTDDATVCAVAIGNGLIGVALRKVSTTEVPLLAVSADDGVTFTFPSPAWPASSPPYGIDVLVFDGSKFIVMGRGWSGTSTNLTAWTFSGDDSGLIPTATFEGFTNGSGITAAAIITEAGLHGTVTTTDGLHWTTVQGGAEGSFFDPTIAKGDLITRTTTGIARQPAGVDGSVLTYDSSQPTGLRAAIPSVVLPTSAARVSRSDGLDLSTSGWSAIEWNTEEFDDDRYFTPTDPTVLTVPTAGRYHLTGNVAWDLGTHGGHRAIAIRRNADDLIAMVENAAALRLVQSISTLIDAQAGDRFELVVASDQVTTVATNAQPGLPNFAIARIGNLFVPTSPRGASWVRTLGPVFTPTNQPELYVSRRSRIRAVTIGTESATGSCVVDVWVAPHASYPPTVANSICGGNKPAIISARVLRDQILAGWNTDIPSGSWIKFNLESTTNFTRIYFQLHLEEIE